MDFLGNLLLDVLAIVMLFIIFFVTLKRSNRTLISHYIYNTIIVVTMILLAVDIFARMDGVTDVSVPVINHIGNFILFLLNPLPAILWVFFILTQIYEDQRPLKLAILPFTIYYLIHVIATILNLFFGFYYTIDANNIYQREPLFVITIIWVMIPLFVGFILTIINRHTIDPKKVNTLLFYPLAPVIGTVVTTMVYGYSIVLPSIAIGAFLVFIGIQNDGIIIDYLTGVYNRRALEDYLRKKIGEANPHFGGIMIDIDRYKQINDTYGHLMGDKALVDFAKILRESIRLTDFVARYGGDEFILIINNADEAGMEATIRRIHNNIDRFNEKDVYPFEFDFSKGAFLYQNSGKMPMEKFLNQLDEIMYIEKKNKQKNEL